MLTESKIRERLELLKSAMYDELNRLKLGISEITLTERNLKRLRHYKAYRKIHKNFKKTCKTPQVWRSYYK
mgnify:CR=1 FL=1